MYLSRITLSADNVESVRFYTNKYAIHSAIMSGFKTPTRVLYRVENPDNFDQLIILVQGALAPLWKPENFPVNTRFETKKIHINCQKNDVLLFKLRANPTKDEVINGRKKRLGIMQESEQLTWLNERANINGFRIEKCIITNEGIVRIRKKLHCMSFLSVVFDGVIIVEDPTSLVKRIEYGFGSAKGFGFGLLSLVR